MTSPGGAVPHVPMTLPRVPAHVFSGQHVLSASKFNREQVNWGRNFVLILLVIKLSSEEYLNRNVGDVIIFARQTRTCQLKVTL